MSTTSAYMVASLLEKMSNSDTDFRYMALNDLTNELQKENFSLEDSTEQKVLRAVLKLLEDKNGEVQNLAVKCLGPLVRRIKEAQVLEVIDQLSNFAAQQKNDELRGIASIGLKTVIVEITPNRASNVCKRIIPRLLQQLENLGGSYEVYMDSLDTLSELLGRFGSLIPSEQQLQIQKVLLPLLSHPRPAVRKRTTVTIGHLVTHISEQQFESLVAFLLEKFNQNQDSSDRLRTLVQTTGVLSRYSASRLGAHIPQFLPIIITYASSEDADDELREICFQSLESFVIRCPTEITPFVDQIIDLALTYLKYDPNYAADEDESEDEEMQDEADDGDEEDDDEIEDYSDDDDDVSWKVRRSASKVLAALIETRHDLLSQLYQTVAPALINRFKEREESVRVDILQTFIILLRQTSLYGGDNVGISKEKDIFDYDTASERVDVFSARLTSGNSNVAMMETEEGPKQLLRALVPTLSKALARQLGSKSTQTRQTGFLLLKELVTVLRGGLDDYFEPLVPAIRSSLTAAVSADSHHIGTNSNLKIETLSFLRNYFRTHSAESVHPYLDRLCPPVIQAVSDKFYKIVSEAFLVCIELVGVLRPVQSDPTSSTGYKLSPVKPEFQPYIDDIYNITTRVLSTSDADQEVKERAIMCLGVLLSHAGDQLHDQKAALQMLLDRLRNEITRLISVRTLTIVARSPVVDEGELQNAVLSSIDQVAVLLRKSNRVLRVASLYCLETLTRRFGQSLSHQTVQTILAELKPLITDADLHLLPLALSNAVVILETNPQSVESIKSEILPAVFQLVQSPLIQGSALTSLLKLFAAIGKASPSDYDSLIQRLINPVLTVNMQGVAAGGVAAVSNKHASSTISQCVAVLATSTDEQSREKTINEFENFVKNPSTNDSIKYLSLLTLGEIGRKADLSSRPDIYNTVLDLFGAQSEEVKSAAAFALGNISIGNVEQYIPRIVAEISEQPKKKYLLLHALKEIITRYTHQEGGAGLANESEKIWLLLFESCESEGEEGTRNVVAECLGKLTLTDPYKFLPDLKNRLTSPSAHVRGTVVTAIKYTFIDQAQHYDELLNPIIVEFLSLIKDEDLNVRRLSLSTLNSAAHNKPYLIRNVLNTLLPLLYQETMVKNELIHLVEMGPFKHKVDDGLEIRKSAFECMYTLLETCLDKVDVYAFLDRVSAGLEDQHEIKVLAHLMIIRLAHVAPTAVDQKIDDMISPLKATIDFKVKGNAVKQEVEKNQELVRSALRAVAALSKLADTAPSARFTQFENEIKSGPYAEEYNNIWNDSDIKETRGDFMDLS
ncbi:armadillo-type protein [Umbelopsis sp. PMI_123]|nr:armadillo-type protein [Umbelopsis sp. PMI_123]